MKERELSKIETGVSSLQNFTHCTRTYLQIPMSSYINAENKSIESDCTFTLQAYTFGAQSRKIMGPFEAHSSYNSKHNAH